METRVLSESDVLPVTLAQLKGHVRMLSDDFDDVLELHLRAALAAAERFTGQCIRCRELEVSGVFSGEVRTGVLPIRAVVSAEVDGRELDAGVLSVEGSVVRFPAGVRGDCFRLCLSAGYEQAPEDVAIAVLLMATRFFEHPSDPVEQLPKASTELLRAHKRWER